MPLDQNMYPGFCMNTNYVGRGLPATVKLIFIKSFFKSSCTYTSNTINTSAMKYIFIFIYIFSPYFAINFNFCCSYCSIRYGLFIFQQAVIHAFGYDLII